MPAPCTYSTSGVLPDCPDTVTPAAGMNCVGRETAAFRGNSAQSASIVVCLLSLYSNSAKGFPRTRCTCRRANPPYKVSSDGRVLEYLGALRMNTCCRSCGRNPHHRWIRVGSPCAARPICRSVLICDSCCDQICKSVTRLSKDAVVKSKASFGRTRSVAVKENDGVII